ncbi:helix-turn-helix domain-containing protein [Candidatus Atribacteria bacterium 1244-E10-H5-B2]|nr:MAG: helix-turn-helix domain-containing protein [Candidatus Atribacteria bacterium 1244-E10-H5-B2]
MVGYYRCWAICPLYGFIKLSLWQKTHTWPSVRTLAEDLGITKNSVRKYREVLIKFGLIKNMHKRRLPDGNYQTNIYEIVRSEDLAYPEQNCEKEA